MRRIFHFVSLLLPVALLLACSDEETTPDQQDSAMPTTVVPSWLELPATSVDDGLEFFSRKCSLVGENVRNYSFYWDYSARVSHWVAYPLCSAYLGSSQRTEAWGYDPLMPAEKQQNVSGGYREGDNGWYARGLQLPAEDRTADLNLNATTFYGTNCVPVDNDFYSWVWHTLETKVRAWATNSDTLYVVSGCVVEGAKHYIVDRSGHKITVPSALYKAVLRYKKDAEEGCRSYMGVAFWYDTEHRYNQFSQNDAMSISKLESKLGYSLFVNLPKVVGEAVAATIKDENPASVGWWWQ
ncbi:MAG: DNA/RNA non-specific endonuclease [Bacteroidales bacterium]|nr:DNA/RNA non-specific endonuclease [Bacteroidales bacterium]